MGAISDHIQSALAKSHDLAEAAGFDHADPNLHLALIAGTMESFVERVEQSGRMPEREDSEDIINALYMILGDYERRRLEKELNGD